MKSKNGKATFPKGMKVTHDRRWKKPIPPQPTRKVSAGTTAPEGHNAKSEPTARLFAQVRWNDGFGGTD